jgi:hypothetical protein
MSLGTFDVSARPIRGLRARRGAVAAAVALLTAVLGIVSPALAMKGNFDSPLNLDSSSRTVDAHGPIAWDAGDVSARVTFTITQGSASGSSTKTYRTTATSWQASITASGGAQFRAGRATATGSVTVATTSGPTTYWWSQAVTIR